MNGNRELTDRPDRKVKCFIPTSVLKKNVKSQSVLLKKAHAFKFFKRSLRCIFIFYFDPFVCFIEFFKICFYRGSF